MHVMKVVAVLKINLFFFYSFFFNPETFNIFPQIWSHYPAESSSGNVKSLQPFRHLFPYRTRVFALAEYNCKLFIWTVHTGTFIFSLQVIISVNRVCVFFFFFQCLCSGFVPLELHRMNNSPAGWWKEGGESAKCWGGVTLVPAGCRSPGRCCGNHSHQPDGISVGEHEKDGSGSVLPGPARLRSNSGPVWYLRSKRVFLDGLAMRSRGETRWKCSLITVTVCLVITHNVTFNCPLRSRRKGYRQSRLKRPIRFSFSKLGLCAFTTSHCNPSVELFFFF